MLAKLESIVWKPVELSKPDSIVWKRAQLISMGPGGRDAFGASTVSDQQDSVQNEKLRKNG